MALHAGWAGIGIPWSIWTHIYYWLSRSSYTKDKNLDKFTRGKRLFVASNKEIISLPQNPKYLQRYPFGLPADCISHQGLRSLNQVNKTQIGDRSTVSETWQLSFLTMGQSCIVAQHQSWWWSKALNLCITGPWFHSQQWNFFSRQPSSMPYQQQNNTTMCRERFGSQRILLQIARYWQKLWVEIHLYLQMLKECIKRKLLELDSSWIQEFWAR